MERIQELAKKVRQSHRLADAAQRAIDAELEEEVDESDEDGEDETDEQTEKKSCVLQEISRVILRTSFLNDFES